MSKTVAKKCYINLIRKRERITIKFGILLTYVNYKSQIGIANFWY